ncbi:sensor histidine kinase [Salibacterium aidingense]|uniref:sensor histidine kinase n=1 Tax=Salibacterium aidingense TaxID=384933 RepID=UPI000420CE58|nr:sensor histidine kinase [Salibacterium aidingense]
MFFSIGSINFKLFFVILVFVCIPLLIFGQLWYEKTTAAIENNAVQYSQDLLKQTNEYLDFYMNDLQQASVPLLSKPQVQSYLDLKKETSSRYERFIISQRIQEDAFAGILDGRSEIFGISMINEKGMQVHNYIKADGYLNMKEIRERNRELWNDVENLEAYQVLDIDVIHETPVLTIVRKVFDENTYDTSGLLIINLRLDKISDIVSEVTSSHFNDVWIVNDQDKIIYHPNPKELGGTFSYEHKSSYHENSFFINRNESLKTLRVYNHSSQTDWTMVASVPLGNIIDSLITLRSSTMWIGLLLIGVALLFVGGFSFFLTHSLTHLQKLMKKVESGNFNIQRKKPLPFYRDDEVSSLYDSFYQMTEKLKHLIQEVKHSKVVEKELELKNRESEFQAMQSQINPHFLYNTLEIINSHAIIENQPMISKMTTSLADMFRYNVSNSKKIVTLSEELRQIRSYLEIQEERFDDLTVSIQCEEETAGHVLMPRLTLQPIIENAFVHGYEEHELNPEFIGIFGEKAPDYYKLSIVDHGKGMPAKTRKELNDAFYYNHDLPDGNKTTKRIGLINVHKRLHGNFGPPYRLKIKQSDDEGTIVEILLPYAGHGQDEKEE